MDSVSDSAFEWIHKITKEISYTEIQFYSWPYKDLWT